MEGRGADGDSYSLSEDLSEYLLSSETPTTPSFVDDSSEGM